MPEMKKTIDAITAQEVEIDNNCARMLNDIKNAEIILTNLETRESELDQQLVNENEYENCLRDIDEANRELTNLNQVVEFAKTSNMNNCRAIDEMEQILKEIIGLIDSTDTEALEETVYVLVQTILWIIFIATTIPTKWSKCFGISVELRTYWQS